jgi:multidrug efflux pump subunit AcrA (membrane-fusion protein)
MAGRVLAVTSTANVQKNTLEVKVAINDPPATIRPEMLVTTAFLAAPRPNTETESGQPPERLLVPRALVDSNERGSVVWIADANGHARRRSIRLRRAGTGELVEVTEGLTPTDKLITSGREGLTDGGRIKITGEDASLGMATAGSGKAGSR